MTWLDISDTRRRDLSPDEQASVEDVLDAAAAWQAGELDFPAAASIGTLLDWRGNPSPPYTRYVAYMHTIGTGDVRWKALDALIDLLIRKQGFRVTRQGIFTATEIAANEAGWQYANLERDAA